MAVRYVSFHGKPVSRQWFQLLTDLERLGIPVRLNSGRRTMAEQAALVRQKGVWSWANPTGAARPTPLAPHIRVGRADHAIDVDDASGSRAKVQAAAMRAGVRLTQTVPGEPWHLEADRAQLRRYASRRAREIRKRKRPPAIRTVSPRGVALVAEFEGGQSKDGLFRPYRDAVGVWTIGYGETQGLIRTLKGRTPPWSKAKALRVLKRRLNRDYASHVAGLKLPLRQGMFDALASFVYNLGAGAIGPDTGVGRELRAHHWHKAADELLKWDKAGGVRLPGLTRRRQAERKLFLSDLDPR